MISSINWNSSLRSPEDTADLIRSTLIGMVSGTILLPVLFAIWLWLTLERDLIHSCDEYGTQKRDLDNLLVMGLFSAWVTGIVFGYAIWNIPGAIMANFVNCAVGGSLLGFWMYLQQKSAK
jgi:hypothetical protein